VAIPFGKAGQQIGIKLKNRRRINWIEPVFLVDGLPPDNTPAPVPFLKEIIKTTSADNVYQNAIDMGALVNGHFGL
jgi:hypothetical protein